MATIESIDQVIKLEDVSGIIDKLSSMKDYFENHISEYVNLYKGQKALVIEGVDLIDCSLDKLEEMIKDFGDDTSQQIELVTKATKEQRKKELQELLERKNLQKQVLEGRLAIETTNLNSYREAYQNSLNEGSPSAHSYQSFVTNCENALADINAKLETINKEIKEIKSALSEL